MNEHKEMTAETGEGVTRRGFIKTVGLGSAAISVGGFGAGAGAAGEEQENRHKQRN